MAPKFLITKIGKNHLGDMDILKYYLENMGFEVCIFNDFQHNQKPDFVYITDIDTKFKPINLKQQIESGLFCLASGIGLAFCGLEISDSGKTTQGLNLINLQSEINYSANLVFSSINSPDFGYLTGYKHLGLELFAQEYKPLGNAKSTWGDNKLVKNSGIIYKNFLGINLSGNLFVNNSSLLKYILQSILDKKLKDGEITAQFHNFSRVSIGSIDDNFSQLIQVQNLEALRINL
jgi:CobQ-like glutamine amidotransferase family enzyme